MAINRVDPGVVANNINSNQVSVTAAPTEIIAQRDLRLTVWIKNLSTTSGEIVYIGDDSVTTADGFPLGPEEIIEIRCTAPIYGVASFSGVITVSTLEEYVTTA